MWQIFSLLPFLPADRYITSYFFTGIVHHKTAKTERKLITLLLLRRPSTELLFRNAKMSLSITYREAQTDEVPTVDLDVREPSNSTPAYPSSQTMSTTPIDVFWEPSPLMLRLILGSNHPMGLKLSIGNVALARAVQYLTSNFEDSSYDRYEGDTASKQQGHSDIDSGRTETSDTAPRRHKASSPLHQSTRTAGASEAKDRVSKSRRDQKTCSVCTRRFKTAGGKHLHLRSAHKTPESILESIEL